MEMLPAMLQEWLQCTPEDECLRRLRAAMYTYEDLDAEEEEVPHLLLQALRTLAGMQEGRRYHLFLMLR